MWLEKLFRGVSWFPRCLVATLLWNNQVSITLFGQTYSLHLQPFRDTFYTLKSNAKTFRSKIISTYDINVCAIWLVIIDKTKKSGQVIIFTGNVAFFQKNCFQQPLRCFRNDCQKTLCSLKSIAWGLPCSVIRDKIGQLIFHKEKFFLFEQYFCRRFRSSGNDCISCTKFFKKPSGPL